MIGKTNFGRGWNNPRDLITRTRGNDALRCTAKVRVADNEVYKCSRDSGHRGNHLCVDFGVYVGFDDWAAGLEEDVVDEVAAHKVDAPLAQGEE